MEARPSTPAVSVTITNYNYAHMVGRAIESVLRQTFTDFELIVADNASTDNSLEVIRRYAERDARVRVIANAENKGLVGNLVVAADAARGAYCVHLDADDWIIAADAFARQVAMLESDPAISLIFSPIVLCDDRGTEEVLRFHEGDSVRPGEVAVEDALKVRILHSGPMFRMSAFRAFGGYDRSFYHSIDVKLAIDLCGQGKVGYVDQPLYAYYQHKSSVSVNTKYTERVRELVRAVESAFEGPLRGRIPDPTRLRREGLRHVLLMFPTFFVTFPFDRDRGKAIRSLYASARVNPRETLLQKRTAILLARMLMGDAAYQRLRTTLQRRSRTALPE